jgi:hypothetical protein
MRRGEFPLGRNTEGTRMKRFNTIMKSVLTILAVVPFSLIGFLVAAIFSKPVPNEPATVEELLNEINNPALSPPIEIIGQPVLINRPDPEVHKTTTKKEMPG